MDDPRLQYIHRGNEQHKDQTVCGILLADYIPDGGLHWIWRDDLREVTCPTCLHGMAEQTRNALPGKASKPSTTSAARLHR